MRDFYAPQSLQDQQHVMAMTGRLRQRQQTDRGKALPCYRFGCMVAAARCRKDQHSTHGFSRCPNHRSFHISGPRSQRMTSPVSYAVSAKARDRQGIWRASRPCHDVVDIHGQHPPLVGTIRISTLSCDRLPHCQRYSLPQQHDAS